MAVLLTFVTEVKEFISVAAAVPLRHARAAASQHTTAGQAFGSHGHDSHDRESVQSFQMWLLAIILLIA